MSEIMAAFAVLLILAAMLLAALLLLARSHGRPLALDVIRGLLWMSKLLSDWAYARSENFIAFREKRSQTAPISHAQLWWDEQQREALPPRIGRGHSVVEMEG